MVTKIQGINVFSITLGATKDPIQITSLYRTTTHPATTPIFTGNIKRQ